MLHKVPPPDTGLRRRAGYSELRAEEDAEQPIPDTPRTSASDIPTDDMAETVKSEGWAALSWSFLASGCLTVSTIVSASLINN